MGGGGRRRVRYGQIDYMAEIPFLHEPKAGFFSTTAENERERKERAYDHFLELIVSDTLGTRNSNRSFSPNWRRDLVIRWIRSTVGRISTNWKVAFRKERLWKRSKPNRMPSSSEEVTWWCLLLKWVTPRWKNWPNSVLTLIWDLKAEWMLPVPFWPIILPLHQCVVELEARMFSHSPFFHDLRFTT